MLELDHLAVSGASLQEAVAHIETALGVAMQAGGAHPRYGTHNRLLGLAEGLYLEAIAVEPGAPAQERPRWFDLDRFSGAPRLSNWILRSPDLRHDLAGFPKAAQRHVAMIRGELEWLMVVPENGVLPYDNMFPAVLQWLGTPPAGTLTPSGCRLKRLVIAHPQAQDLRAELADLTDPRVVFETGAPGCRAEFATPHGARVLE